MGACAEIARQRAEIGPARPGPAKARQAPRLNVRFWWAGYKPADVLLDPLRREEITLESKSLDGRTYIQAFGTLDAVWDYMVRADLVVLKTKLVRSRQDAGHWEGLYDLQIGRRA